MAVTLRDIARHVNLSHATVSFVLNNRRDVAIPEHTRERVLKAAAELGYRPNRAARALVLGKTLILGVWTPPLSHSIYLPLFEAIHHQIRKAGYETLISEQSSVEAPSSPTWPVDGIFAIDVEDGLSQDQIPKGLPTVAIGFSPSGDTDQVWVDLSSGSADATLHLLEAGRSQVALISQEGPGASSPIDAHRTIIEAAGSQPISLQLAAVPSRQTTNLLHDFIRDHTELDGIVCTHPEMTALAQRLLAHFGRTGVEVIGITKRQSLQGKRIEIPIELMATEALQLLKQRIESPEKPITSVALPSSLVLPPVSPQAVVDFPFDHVDIH